MSRHVVARADEIPEGGRLVVTVNGHSIGVFHERGRFFAVLNRCPHQGAQLCRGRVVGRLEADVPGELVYDGSRPLIRCPWHGWEYDLETGRAFFRSAVRPYTVGIEEGDEVSAQIAAGTITAETYDVAVDDDYLVLDLKRRPAQ
jgi:3-phenylpropionate/trans-cinnamate dioxygenase ferredoxin subunit